MNWHQVVQVVIVAVIIAAWWRTNDADVAVVTAKPGLSVRLVTAMVVGGIDLAYLPVAIIQHDWPDAIMDAVVGFLCLRIIWHWWRRRRQGKPSRVLGLVRDLGHKLTVVNIPAEES